MSLYYSIPILVFFSALCFVFGMDFMRGSRSVLGGYFTHYDNVFALARHLSPVLANYLPDERVDHYEAKLLWAGSPLNLTVETFVGMKLLFALFGAITGIVLMLLGIAPLMVVVCAVGCFFFPDVLLNERVSMRQWRVTSDMPLMLGLLVTALRSGVEYGQAFSAVAENFPGALGEELRVAWELMATGTPRREAMRRMAFRTGVISVRRFSDTVIASSERGNDQFSLQLELLCKDALDALYKAAQEDARKKPALILLPLFLFILTPTLIMLLAPILMQISNMM